MALNTYLRNLVDDMKKHLHRSNGYSSKPTINKGVRTIDKSVFPLIEVTVVKPTIVDSLGDKLEVNYELIIACHTKVKQADNNDVDNNNMFEDILQYLHNDCIYKDTILIGDDPEFVYGSLDRGDTVLTCLISITLIVEYEKTTIND